MNIILYFIRPAQLAHSKILKDFRKMISISLNSLLLLNRNFTTARRCFSFLVGSKYSDLLTSVLKVE